MQITRAGEGDERRGLVGHALPSRLSAAAAACRVRYAASPVPQANTNFVAESYFGCVTSYGTARRPRVRAAACGFKAIVTQKQALINFTNIRRLFAAGRKSTTHTAQKNIITPISIGKPCICGESSLDPACGACHAEFMLLFIACYHQQRCRSHSLWARSLSPPPSSRKGSVGSGSSSLMAALAAERDAALEFEAAEALAAERVAREFRGFLNNIPRVRVERGYSYFAYGSR